MDRYTLELALFDYLHVIVAAIGLYLVCRYCAMVGGRDGPWIYLIPLIAVTGGTLKATWKLIVVLSGTSIQWMSDQLFFFLASSYVLMASLVVMSLRAGARGEVMRETWWRIPTVLAVGLVLAALAIANLSAGRSWVILLLATLSITNLVFSIRLIAHSAARRNWLSTLGFSLNLIVAYTLVGLARIPEQTLELQWAEEVLNLVANTALALAAWYLIRSDEPQPEYRS